MKQIKNILLLSEIGHIAACESFLAENPLVRNEEHLIIPLDVEIEYSLIEKGIPFESGRLFRTNNADPMILSEKWSMDILDSAPWAFFRYREVLLSHIYFLPLQMYLTPLFYYVDVVSNIVARYSPIERLVVFPSANRTPPTGFSLESHRIRALVDAVKTIAEQSHIEVLVPHVASSAHQLAHTTFKSKRVLFSLGIGVLNTFISLLRRPRRIRILASDYWKNIAPYLRNLDSVEVVLIDRTEAFKVGLANIFKYRMRFLHLDAFAEGKSRDREQARSGLVQGWQSVRANVPTVTFRGFSLQSLVINALDTVVEDANEKSLRNIDDAYVLLERLKPDVVELRTTTSIQTHVGILAQVARACGVPSLEMQHGIEYYCPGSMDRRHRAEYMGVYGKLIQQELKEAGDNVKTVIIGSPRFDVYTHLENGEGNDKQKSKKGIVFLCIALNVLPGVVADTYDVEEYFRAIGAALRTIPGSSIIIKLRGKHRESFYKKVIAVAFEGVSYTIEDDKPLWGLFAKAEVVISCYSTAVLEALQCEKPLIYLGVSAEERMIGAYHFSRYAERGALRIAMNEEDLAQALRELVSPTAARADITGRAKTFLEREYAFDGKAGERAATLIETLATKESR